MRDRDDDDDVGSAGGPDERLVVLVVMLEVLNDRLFEVATLAKPLRCRGLSEVSRKNRSTVFSHEALVGVK